MTKLINLGVLELYESDFHIFENMRKVSGIFSLIWKLYTGIVFTTTAILLYPIILPFLYSLKGRKRAFRIFVFWSWLFRILCFYHVRKVTSNPLPKGPYIILANHISYLDIFLMYSILPNEPFLFLGKSELLNYPIIGTYFKRLNIPVFRVNRVKTARALVIAKQEVTNGWSIGIFPEGRIPDNNPKMIPFKLGAFQLAKELELPIIPMTYVNNHRLFSDPVLTLGTARPGISRVHIHPYISKEEVIKTELSELRSKCFHIVNATLLETYPELRE